MPAPARAGVAWAARVRLGGLVLAAALLPFAINPRWYDVYYWPKVQFLYGATGVLGLLVLFEGQGASVFRVLRSPLGIALGAWLVALGLATLLSADPLTSLVGQDYRYEGLLTWLAYGALAALTAGTFTQVARIRWLVAALMAAAAVMAAIGLAQHAGWAVVPEDFDRLGMVRAWGTTGNPLALGAYLVLLLPLPISLYVWTPAPRQRWVYGSLVVLLYAALVATGTRAAWGALALGVAVWAAATGPNRLRAAVRPLLALAAALVLVTPLVLSTGRLDIARVVARDSEDLRMFLWRTTAPLVWQRPLLGWGPETLAEIYPAYHDPQFTQVFPEARMQHLIVDRPHNDLLQQAVSTGLLGLAVYAWLWLVMLLTAWQLAGRERRRAAAGSPASTPLVSAGDVRTLRRGRGLGEGRFTAALASGLLAGMVAYFAQLQFSFSYVSVAPVFWTLVGVLLALARDPAARDPAL